MNEQHLNGSAPGEAKEGFPTEANARGDKEDSPSLPERNGTQNANPNGRPPLRSKELEEIILRRMREGDSLVEICDDPDLPCRDTVYAWLAADEERRAAKTVPEGEVLFSERYTIAARIRSAAMAEEILSIADDGRNDTYKDATSKICVDYDHIQRCKLRVDTRKWLMSKLEPKKYGDRPSEVHVATTLNNNNCLVPLERLRQIQQRNREAMER